MVLNPYDIIIQDKSNILNKLMEEFTYEIC